MSKAAADEGKPSRRSSLRQRQLFVATDSVTSGGKGRRATIRSPTPGPEIAKPANPPRVRCRGLRCRRHRGPHDVLEDEQLVVGVREPVDRHG